MEIKEDVCCEYKRFNWWSNWIWQKTCIGRKEPKSWCKSVSAFANTFGGALIFGISDAGQIVGLGNPEGDAEKISEVIKSRLDPIPEFKLRFHKADDEKILVILEIYKGDEICMILLS